jgi:signal transduction histidine kinase
MSIWTIRGMNERMRQLGGRMELVSKEGGTTVCAIVPARASSSSTTAASLEVEWLLEF